jgi:hypothetical protein
MGDRMTEVHHIGAQLKLLCPTRHHVGHLRQLSFAPTEIRFWSREGGKESWPPSNESGPAAWWTVPCPDGCPGRFGGSVEVLRAAVMDLGNDPERDEGEYTLSQAEA